MNPGLRISIIIFTGRNFNLKQPTKLLFFILTQVSICSEQLYKQHGNVTNSFILAKTAPINYLKLGQTLSYLAHLYSYHKKNFNIDLQKIIANNLVGTSFSIT